MTIHDMMQQVSLLTAGKYSRNKSKDKNKDISRIEIRTPGERKQLLFGRIQEIDKENVGVLYTVVGVLKEEIDPVYLLEMNALLRYSRIAVTDNRNIVLVAMFDLRRTSINECAPILQELAAVADDLEQRWYRADIS